MHLIRKIYSTLIFGGMFVFVGCAGGKMVPPVQTPKLASSHELLELSERRSQEASSEYRISEGDQIVVNVFGVEELNTTTVVSNSGSIMLPLLGPVVLEGMTSEEAAEHLAAKWGRRYLIDPVVSVHIAEHRRTMTRILGEVARPGTYEMPQNATLLDLIAMAGGLTSSASPVAYLLPGQETAMAGEASRDEVRDIAKGKWSPEDLEMASLGWVDSFPTSVPVILSALIEEGDRASNLGLRNGDTFTVPTARSVYVTGGVAKRGMVALTGPLTLTHAIALAGGTKASASIANVQIMREDPNGGAPTILRANVGDILDGEEPDILLQPNDVIHIPQSLWRQVFSGTLSFMRTLTGFGLRIF